MDFMPKVSSKPPPLNRDLSAEENKSLMSEMQQRRDQGATLGLDQRDPCAHEAHLHAACLSRQQRENALVGCDDLRQLEFDCRRFWDAVQAYRRDVLHESTLKWPLEHEEAAWRRQFPDFVLTGQLRPPRSLEELHKVKKQELGRKL